MATKKRLIYLEDAIAKIVNTTTKVIDKAFFMPGMLDILVDRQFEIIDMLEDIPTMDAVEVVHGRWIKGKELQNTKFIPISNALYCSACKEEAYWDTDYGQQEFDYCPNCGAKMDLKGE